jgi:hypothetical protein
LTGLTSPSGTQRTFSVPFNLSAFLYHYID